MENEVQINFGDRSVSTSKTTWHDLIGNGTPTAFGGVVAAIRNVVAGGGHFMIENEDGSIHRRIDRMSEVEELVADANQERVIAGQEPPPAGKT